MPIFSQILLKIEKEDTHPNSFYETGIIMISNPEKDIIRKENYRSIFLMNIDAKIFYKTLANIIQATY